MWRMTRRSARRDVQAGAAATEMALLSLVLVPTLFYSIFLFELSWVKIKAREVARYGVWELSAVGLSDWKTGTAPAHEARFTANRDVVMQELSDRYGDDLQSATPAYLSNGPKMLSMNVTVPMDQATMTNVDAELWNVENKTVPIPSEIGSSIDWIFDRFSFTRKGRVEAEFKVHVENKMLRRTMPVFYLDKMLTKDAFDVPVKQRLLVEQWDLKDGKSVVELHQTNCAGKKGSDFCLQVQRMSFIGLADKTAGLLTSDASGQGLLNKVLQFLNIHNPLEAVVHSKPLSGAPETSAVPLDLFVPENHGGIKHHNMHKNSYFSSPYKDTKGNNDSPYTKAYNKRGPYFLGCKDPQMQEGYCSYK